MKFDHQMFISLYETSPAPQFGALDDNQALGIDALLGFLEQDAGVSDVRWAAYMLATTKWECADMWQPIEEIGMGQGQPYGNPVTVTASGLKAVYAGAASAAFFGVPASDPRHPDVRAERCRGRLDAGGRWRPGQRPPAS